ncbi:MAG: methionine--tRNA ligase [bacterium]|nr:methionine--tRNA ligase [bacterium]
MQISFSDFQKLELKIGTIKEAEYVEGSEKLLKLKVDFGSKNITPPNPLLPQEGEAKPPQIPPSQGEELRQIIAGIGKSYTPEELIGRQCAFVVNLEPRKLMGLESQGMLLAPSNSEGKPVLLIPEKPVEPGSAIH